MLKILVRGWKQYQIVRKKQTADLAASNSDTVVDFLSNSYSYGR